VEILVSVTMMFIGWSVVGFVKMYKIYRRRFDDDKPSETDLGGLERLHLVLGAGIIGIILLTHELTSCTKNDPNYVPHPRGAITQDYSAQNPQNPLFFP